MENGASKPTGGQAGKPRRSRWVALAVVLAALVVALVLGALGLRQVSRWNVFPGSPLPVPSAAELSPRGLEPLDYRTSDGVALRGVWAAPEGDGAAVVVYFHGNAESAARNLGLAAACSEAGFGALLAEYRGYGGLEGSPTEEGLYRDGLAAVEALRERGVDEGRLVLVGRSLGSGVAVDLAARGVGRGLVLVSPYTSMVDMGRAYVGPLAPLLVPDRFDSEAKAASVRVPAAVIHGTADDLVPFAMAEALVRRLPRGRLVPIEGAGHVEIPDLEETIVREVAAVVAEGEARPAAE